MKSLLKKPKIKSNIKSSLQKALSIALIIALPFTLTGCLGIGDDDNKPADSTSVVP